MFLSSNSLDFSLMLKNQGIKEEELEEEKKNKADSGDELNLNSTKYEKISYLTDLNTVIESEAVIKKVNKVKYYNDYKLIKELGRGSICKVKLVEKNNVKYALKIVNKALIFKQKKFIQNSKGETIITTPLEGIMKEIAILRKINHRNLVKLYEIMENKKKKKLYLVLEYCEHGDLMEVDDVVNKFTVNKHIFENYLKNKEELTDIDKFFYSEIQIRRFIRQIIRGLNYLHRIGIIHGDIKPNNILLDKNNECKIIDFNFSSILDNNYIDNLKQKIDCNDYFKPPELINISNSVKEKSKDMKGMPVDIWAIGILSYILSYKKFPFFSETGNLFELMDKIKKAEFQIPNTPKRSEHFKYFLKKCLEKDPNKRITSEKILNLKWINLGEKEHLKNQCKKVVRFAPSKNEIFKNLAFFSINYDDIEKLKKDERASVKKVTNKLLDKIPKGKEGKKLKIKIKIKKSNKSNKFEEDEK
jgi:serine/threonine protein kinase